MKQIKKKTKMKRSTKNRILFWVTNAYCIIISILAIIDVFAHGTTEMKIGATITYAIIIPIAVIYAKAVYDIECYDWRPLSD